MYCMSLTDVLSICLRQAEIFHLTFFYEVFDGTGYVFDGDGGIEAVLIEEINAVGVQSSERAFHGGADMGGPAVETFVGMGLGIELKAKFRSDDHFAADRG